MGSLFKSVEKKEIHEDEESSVFGWTFYNEERRDEVYSNAIIYYGHGIEKPLFIGAGDKTIFCLQSDSGEELWRYNLKDDMALIYPILMRDNNIFLLTKNRLLQVLNIEYRQILWDKGIEFPLKYASCGENRLLLCAAHEKESYYGVSKILASSFDDGSVFWEKEISVISPPVILGDKVFLNTSAGFIYGISMENGTILWKHNMFLEKGAFYMTALRDSIFIGERDLIYALDCADGSVNWKLRTKSEICPDIIVNQNTLYALTMNGEAYALDTDTGTVMWCYEGPPVSPSGRLEEFTIKPLAEGGRLFINRSDCFFALNEDDGALLFSLNHNSGQLINAPQPVRAADNLIFTNGRKTIFWFDLKGNSVTGTYELTEDPSGIVALKSFMGMVFIMTRFGSVFSMNVQESDMAVLAETLKAEAVTREEHSIQHAPEIESVAKEEMSEGDDPLKEEHSKPEASGNEPDMEISEVDDLPDILDIEGIIDDIEKEIKRKDGSLVEEKNEIREEEKPLPAIEITKKVETAEVDAGKIAAPESTAIISASGDVLFSLMQEMRNDLGEIRQIKGQLESVTANLDSMKGYVSQYFQAGEKRNKQLIEFMEFFKKVMGRLAEQSTRSANELQKLDLLIKHVSHVFKFMQFLKQEIDAVKAMQAKIAGLPPKEENQ